ncbi:Rha family transcriptional regulator [Enterococcus sp. AZ126]|uniref:Rha family transcriptional regulator n=1 Tax=Enterococcus sp. AZ126 TaxID=2774635 RepID=UPI003F23ECE0
MEVLEQTLDSREVAKMVKRNHKEVLRDIRKIISRANKSKNALVSFFIESSYTDNKGEDRPCFLLTKKGCELFSTRMTGSKGDEFAMEYIERFNDMETHIKQREQLPQSPRDKLKLMYEFQEDTAKRVDEVADRVTEIEENTKIDASDYGYIGRRVNQRVKEIARGYNATNKDQLATLYKDINTGVKQITGVSTRSQLRQKDFDKVNEYINNWQPSTATITIIKDMRDSA